jgi:acyl-homoserine-lactone acylase
MQTPTRRTAKLYRTKFSVKVACLLGLMAAHPEAEEVTIYRDGWGVPHIYGETDRSVAFGFGYAQAEDRLQAVLNNYAQATGRLAAKAGKQAVGSDFQQRLWGHHRTAQTEFDNSPQDVREWTTAFAAGVNHYLAQTNTSPDSGSVSAEDVLALGRHLFWRGIQRQLDAEYANTLGTDLEVKPSGSVWGISPERTAHDATILAIDPSESWSQAHRWYEVHLHGRRIHAWGFTYPGLPVPVFGHNRKAGWGWLPHGPDTGDVYRITFTSDVSDRYRWDGKTRIAISDTFQIAVKDGQPSVLTGQRTHLGPIIHRNGSTGYAYRIPETGAGQIAQLFTMLHASNFRAFYDAIRPGNLGPATFLYGDTSGALFYIRSGRVPIRPESVDWDRVIETDIDSDWIGTHVQEDLVQLLDPRAGWVIDAGTSPDLITGFAPVTPDRYPDYVFNALPGRQSDRSSRLRKLIRASPRMGLDEALKINMDTYVIGSIEWVNALAVAVSILGPQWNDDERFAYDMLRGWDGRAETDRLGVAIYVTWREACAGLGRAIDARSIQLSTGISNQTRSNLVRAFRSAVVTHKKRYGHLDVRWKEVHRSKHSARSWGIPGIARDNIASIRSIHTQQENVVEYATGGQSAPTTIVLHSEGIRSYSAVPFGQSDRDASPHSWDQGEALFTQGVLKPTRFDTKPKDLKKKQVLRIPEDLFPIPDREAP